MVAGLKEEHWLLILQEASETASKIKYSGNHDDDISDASNVEEVIDLTAVADEDEDSDLEALKSKA